MRRTIPLLIAFLVIAAGVGLLLKPTVQAGKDPVPLTLLGDGVADNTEVIRQLIQHDGPVIFPRGVFRISEPIVIDLAKSGPIAISAAGNATLLMDGPGPA